MLSIVLKAMDLINSSPEVRAVEHPPRHPTKVAARRGCRVGICRTSEVGYGYGRKSSASPSWGAQAGFSANASQTLPADVGNPFPEVRDLGCGLLH